MAGSRRLVMSEWRSERYGLMILFTRGQALWVEDCVDFPRDAGRCMDRQGSTCLRQERTRRLKTLALSIWYIGMEMASLESSLFNICAMAECRALVSCLTERRDCDCVCVWCV